MNKYQKYINKETKKEVERWNEFFIAVNITFYKTRKRIRKVLKNV